MREEIKPMKNKTEKQDLSLGGTLRFAAADLSGFKKNNDKETKAIFSNCKTELAMKNVDSKSQQETI